jgi:DNA adenine methylase
MKVTAIAPWMGSKRTLAPEIVRELGPHTQFFEPFCGSMAVLLAKDPSRNETVNDLHGDLINLALILQDPRQAVELYERLQRTLFHEELFKKSLEMLDIELPQIERAYWYFLHSWMGRNGIAGIQKSRGSGLSLAVRWTAGGGSPTVRFRSVTESIPAWHARLQNVVILNRDAFEIIPRFDDAETTAIYVDPPYLADTRSGFNGSGGQSRYEHEFNHGASSGLFKAEDDHARLAEILCAFKRARIVVSYYDHPRLKELYPGWRLVSKTRQKNLARQNAKEFKTDEAPEVLIINGPSFAKG